MASQNLSDVSKRRLRVVSKESVEEGLRVPAGDTTFDDQMKTAESMLHALQAKIHMFDESTKDMAFGRSQTGLDFKSLKETFSIACPDFSHKILWEKPMKCVNFCETMMFIVGPASRQKIGPALDQQWNFIFNYNNDAGKYIMHTVVVSTYKSSPAPVTQPAIVNGVMQLTMKQAGLLAVDIFCRILPVAVAKKHYMVSPLCGAIFSRDDVPKIGKLLNLDDTLVLQRMNASCQSGGHHLEQSDSAFAYMAAVIATSQMKDDGLRDRIIGKIYKQYNSVKKTFDSNTFDILCKFANCGIPAEYAPKKMIQRFKDIQDRAMKRSESREIDGTSLRTNIYNLALSTIEDSRSNLQTMLDVQSEVGFGNLPKFVQISFRNKFHELIDLQESEISTMLATSEEKALMLQSLTTYKVAADYPIDATGGPAPPAPV